MKKMMLLLCAAVLCVSLCACSANSGQMYIEAAKLDNQAESVMQLLGKGHLYDFRLDGNMKSMQINAYELIDGQWSMITGGGMAVSGDKGRLGITFDQIGDGLRVAVQSGSENSVTAYSKDTGRNEKPMARLSCMLSGRKAVNYEQEIPLAVQIIAAGSAASPEGVEGFFTPEIYAGKGYEHVYALTVIFSTAALE